MASYECTICSGGIRKIGDAAFAPCGHMFHAACLDHWITSCKRSTCPICCHLTPKVLRIYTADAKYNKVCATLNPRECTSFPEFEFVVGKHLFDNFPLKSFKVAKPLTSFDFAMDSIDKARILLEKCVNSFGYFLVRRAAHFLCCMAYSDDFDSFIKTNGGTYYCQIEFCNTVVACYAVKLRKEYKRLDVLQIDFCGRLLEEFENVCAKEQPCVSKFHSSGH